MPSNKDPVSTVQPGSGADPVSGPSVIVPVSTQAGRINTDSPGVWADGATVSGGALQGVLSSIIGVLSSVLGANKVGADPAGRPAWADGTTNVATTVGGAILGIMQALTSATGKYGAGKISVGQRDQWADLTPNPATNVADALADVVKHLTSVTGKYGAGKVSAAVQAIWADGTSIPAGNVADTLESMVGALTSFSGGAGAAKIRAPALTGARFSTIASRLDLTLQALANAANTLSASEAVGALAQATLSPNTLSPNNLAAAMAYGKGVLVGTVSSTDRLRYSVDGGVSWTPVSLTGYSGYFSHVIWQTSLSRFVALGTTGIRASSDGISWSTTLSTLNGSTNRLHVLPSGTLIHVMQSGVVLRSVDNGANWTSSTSLLNGGTYTVLGTVVVGSTVIAHGYPTPFDSAKAAYYSVDDGVSWSVLDLSTRFPSGSSYIMELSALPNGVVVAVVLGVNEILLWASGNFSVPSTWQLVQHLGNNNCALSQDGPIVVAVTRNDVASALMFVSMDGLVWSQVPRNLGGIGFQGLRFVDMGAVKAWFIYGTAASSGAYLPKWGAL